MQRCELVMNVLGKVNSVALWVRAPPRGHFWYFTRQPLQTPIERHSVVPEVKIYGIRILS